LASLFILQVWSNTVWDRAACSGLPLVVSFMFEDCQYRGICCIEWWDGLSGLGMK